MLDNAGNDRRPPSSIPRPRIGRRDVALPRAMDQLEQGLLNTDQVRGGPDPRIPMTSQNCGNIQRETICEPGITTTRPSHRIHRRWPLRTLLLTKGYFDLLLIAHCP